MSSLNFLNSCIKYNYEREQPKAEILKFEIGENLFNYSDNLINLFEEDGNIKIVFVSGLMRTGKSTLLNYLTCNGLQETEDGKFKNKDKIKFETGPGIKSITKGFLYYRMNIKTFKALHFEKYPDDIMDFRANNYDLIFIDSEGLGSLKEFSKNLLISSF